MIRVLFVDDDPMVLQGLQRTLRSMRGEWSMAFADSGAKALELLAQNTFDVVVSDMRMAPMDGAALLNEVMRLYPGTIRLVLSGHSDRDLVMKCVGAAHQYLAKPCAPEELKDVIRRTTSLNQLLSNQKLQSLVARLDRLPTIPAIYAQMTSALEKPEVDTEELGELISHDISMTAEILKVVNSAFFGLGHKISSPIEAVQFLGTETVRTLVLVVHLCSEYRHLRIGRLNVDHLWDHSYRVAILAREIALAQKADRRLIDEAFAAAVLHDVGKLVLATNLPQLCTEICELQRSSKAGLCEVEQSLAGSTHAEVGAYLLGLWGLPSRLVEAVARHHNPSLSEARTFDPATAVHVADWLVHQDRAQEPDACSADLDIRHLESLGLLSQVDQWKQCMKSLPQIPK
jgi:putative nucleotidyltransferase with HDIG domain